MKLNIANAYRVLERYLKGMEETEEYQERIKKIDPDVLFSNYDRSKRPKKKKSKFEHSKSVAIISAMLAQKWGAIVEYAIIIGLLHDIGKTVDEEKMLTICLNNNIPVYEFEFDENVIALHGKISALIFQKEFKGNNTARMKRISRGIESHVAGGVNMNLLEKIVFIADNIDGKEGGIKLLSDILSGKINNPDECIKIIIRTKNQEK